MSFSLSRSAFALLFFFTPSLIPMHAGFDEPVTMLASERLAGTSAI